MAQHHSVTGHVRSAKGEPLGALVLFGGRGPSELHDLLGIADGVDPGRRLLVLSASDGPDRSHTAQRYYERGEIDFPDGRTRTQELDAAQRWLAEVAENYGADPERTVLAGFSHGGLIAASIALANTPTRYAGLALLASPPIEPMPAMAEHRGLPVYVGHGDSDPLIPTAAVNQIISHMRHAGLRVEHHVWDATSHRFPVRAHQELSSWIFSEALARAERYEREQRAR